MKTITDHRPAFLKEAYKWKNVELIPHDGWVQPLEKFIRWDGKSWRVYTMTIERVPRLLGIYPTCASALHAGS